MTARRDIQPGEELTYDYCTSDTVLATRLRTCYCGTSLCRGTPLDSRLSLHFAIVVLTHHSFMTSFMTPPFVDDQRPGGLTGKEWQDPELRQRYQEHWVPYILDLIKARDESA